MKDRHVLTNGYLSATIKTEGAELCSLRDSEDAELLWQAEPVWPRHAPVLFPIVGRLKDDMLRHRGRSYRITQHGFARDRRFAWLQRTATSSRLALHDDAATRAQFPFAFRFEIAYALADDALEITYTVGNPGREVLPVS
ncbi:MAG: aldose 1-epimerase family protein, partial [Acetobacteraceae bacterium]|nr:aldose 1-epimerase family protein [Acetobacteraceae bacterium]